jgi:hypothetical protein
VSHDRVSGHIGCCIPQARPIPRTGLIVPAQRAAQNDEARDRQIGRVSTASMRVLTMGGWLRRAGGMACNGPRSEWPPAIGSDTPTSPMAPEAFTRMDAGWDLNVGRSDWGQHAS